MRHFYFIGIGGTAMASVAAALHAQGHRVQGSDLPLYPPMSTFLDERGIERHEGYDGARIGTLPPDSVIVVGNAISRGNSELEAVLREHRRYTSLAALLGEELIAGSRSIVISGTHGKSTTTSLTAWLLESAGLQPGFLVGGIPENFGQGCRMSPAGGVFVSEGDEYDTAFFDKRSKFVHYRPDIAVVHNVEFDHADIFDNIEQIKRSFRHFLQLVPDNGVIAVNADDHHAMDVAANAHAPVVTYGFGYSSDVRARDIRYFDGKSHFTVRDRRDGHEYRFALPMAGEFNIMNALAAIVAVRALGVSDEAIQQGFDSFRGLKRRMEVLAEIAGITVIDDFAHHPTALRLTLTALREKYPGRRLVACFEPRSNTTTRNIYQQEIAEALAVADVAVIGAIDRPQRYSEEQRLSPERVADSLRAQGRLARAIPDAGEMVRWLGEVLLEGDVIALCSNGKFGNARQLVQNMLHERCTV